MIGTKKDREISIKAVVITIIVHFIIIAGLYFVTISSNIATSPKQMNMVVVTEVQGQASRGQGNTIKIEEQSQSLPKSVQTKVTTNTIKPINKAENKLSKAKTKSPDNKAKSVLQKQPSIKEKEDKARKEAIEDNVANAFSRKASQQSTLSVENTNNTNTITKGKGVGDGSYSLDGRSIVGNGGFPVRPSTTKAIYGRVVVGVLVNPSGIVIDAWIDPKGTQIANPEVRNSAIEAAKVTKFNAVGSANNQRGKIIYNFTIK